MYVCRDQARAAQRVSDSAMMLYSMASLTSASTVITSLCFFQMPSWIWCLAGRLASRKSTWVDPRVGRLGQGVGSGSSRFEYVQVNR